MYRITLIVTFLFLNACAVNKTPLFSYNEHLLSLEKRMSLCKEVQNEKITDNKTTGLSSDALRAGIGYFYIRNSIACYKKEKSGMLIAAARVVGDKNISELIRYNAQLLIDSYGSDQKIISETRVEFESLTALEKEGLKKLTIALRPFNAISAAEYFLNDD